MILFLGGIGKIFSSAAKAIGGVVEGAAKTITGGLGGIVDSFSKVGGGNFLGALGGIIGGPPGAIIGNLLGSIAKPGQPPLPGGFGGLLGKIGNLVGGAMSKITQSPIGKMILGGMGPMGQLFGKGMDIISKLLGKLGAKQPQSPHLPGCFHPAPQPGGTGGTGGAGGASGAGGDKGLLNAAGKAYDQLGSIEKQIQNLDPDSPDYQKKLMMLQQKMNKLMEMIKLISQLMTAKHQTAMGVISNIR